jgi:hypothetical protein
MDWKDIARPIMAVAPTIAKVIGGPAGILVGTAAQALSDAILGRPDGTPEEVSAAIASATPEQLLALKKQDHDFKLAMERIEVDLEKIAAEDRDSARNREIRTKDWTPRVLVIVVTVAWAGMMYILTTDVVPSANRELLARAMGTMDTLLVMAWAYFFGSSAGSARKSDTLDRLTGGKL